MAAEALWVVFLSYVVQGSVIEVVLTRNEGFDGATEDTRVMDVSDSASGRLDDGFNDERVSHDMLYPILVGVAAKLLSTIPVVLTSLALVAGYSLATGKAALLLAAVAAGYQYISNQFVVPIAKHKKHLGHDWGGVDSALLEHYGYHPQHHWFPGLMEYHRDRNDRGPGLQLVDST